MSQRKMPVFGEIGVPACRIGANAANGQRTRCNVFAEDELEKDGTFRKFRIVRQEGQRQVQRNIEH